MPLYLWYDTINYIYMCPKADIASLVYRMEPKNKKSNEES